MSKITTLDALRDLYVQATTDRSHYYTGNVVLQAIEHIKALERSARIQDDLLRAACTKAGIAYMGSDSADALADQIKESTPLDSYECTHAGCGLWVHLPPVSTTCCGAEPAFCPYCGHQTLRWRSDTMYSLIEHALTDRLIEL